METQWAIIEERLSRAERQVRVLRGLLLAAFVGIVALAAVKPGITDGTGTTVKAPFRVVNGKGDIILQSDEVEAGARLCLFDKDENPRAFVLSGEEGGAVGIVGNKGQSSAGFTATDDEASFDITNREGKRLVALTSNGGRGGLVLCNQDTKPSVVAFGGKEGDDGGAVAIMGKGGKLAAGLTIDEDGGILGIADHKGTSGGDMVMTKHGGFLRMFDSGGKVTFCKP